MNVLSFKPFKGLSWSLTILFSMYIILACLGILLNGSMLLNQANPSGVNFIFISKLIILIGGIKSLLFISSAILFFIWIYKTTKALTLLNKQTLRFSPAWSVIGFFIPLYNLFYFNYVIWTQTWKASAPDSGKKIEWQGKPSTSLIACWYSSYLIYLICFKVHTIAIDAIKNHVSIFIIYSGLCYEVFSIITAIFCLLLILSINTRLSKKQLTSI